MLNALSKPSKGRVNHDKHWICDKIALFSWSAQTTSATLCVCSTLENIFVWSPARPRSHLADLIFPLPPFLTWLIGHPRRLHALSWPPYCHRQDFNSRQIRVICLRWRPFDQHACLYKSSQTQGMATKKASCLVWSGLDRWGIYLGRQDATQCILGFHQCILAMIGPL